MADPKEIPWYAAIGLVILGSVMIVCGTWLYVADHMYAALAMWCVAAIILTASGRAQLGR